MNKTKSSDKILSGNVKENINVSQATSVQKEVPVVGTKGYKKAGEAPFTLYMPSTLLRNLKVKAATEGVSIKELIVNAIIKEYDFK